MITRYNSSAMNGVILIIIGLLFTLASFSNQIGPLNLPKPSLGSSPQTSLISNVPVSDSRNWAGYVAQNGVYTGVTGSWTVPQVTESHPGADATWVGIGGVATHDLIQAGTQQAVSRNGRVIYEAWVETLPESSQPLNLDVNPGDLVTVSLNEQSSGSWQITVKDNTTGQSAVVNRQYNSFHSSAEWIEEAPSAQRGVLPLDNFGSVHFSNATAVKNDRTETIAQANGKAVTMLGAMHQILATASALGSDGASFTVNPGGSNTVQNPAPQTGYQTSRPRVRVFYFRRPF